MCFFFRYHVVHKLPHYRNARIAEYWPPDKNVKQGGPQVKLMSGERPAEGPEKPVFPLIMFSHDLGGSRAAHSSVCGEFVSYGFVICAMKHRNGSGVRTLVKISHAQRFRQPPRTRNSSTNQALISTRSIWWASFSPKMIQTIRCPATFITHRSRYASQDWKYIRQWPQSAPDRLSPWQKRRRHELLFPKPRRYRLDLAENRIHLTKVTMVGHSLGTATTIEVAYYQNHFQWVSQAIMYNVWGMAISPPEPDFKHRIHVPLRGTNSEAFMYWPDNFNVVKAICE